MIPSSHVPGAVTWFGGPKARPVSVIPSLDPLPATANYAQVGPVAPLGAREQDPEPTILVSLST